MSIVYILYSNLSNLMGLKLMNYNVIRGKKMLPSKLEINWNRWILSTLNDDNKIVAVNIKTFKIFQI